MVNSVNEKGEDCYFCVHDDWWSECLKVVKGFMRWFLKGLPSVVRRKKKDRRNRSKKYKQKKIREETHQHTNRNPPFFKSFLKTNLKNEKKNKCRAIIILKWNLKKFCSRVTTLPAVFFSLKNTLPFSFFFLHQLHFIRFKLPAISHYFQTIFFFKKKNYLKMMVI